MELKFGIVRTSSALAKLLTCGRGTTASLRDDRVLRQTVRRNGLRLGRLHRPSRGIGAGFDTRLSWRNWLTDTNGRFAVTGFEVLSAGGFHSRKVCFVMAPRMRATPIPPNRERTY